MTNKQFFIRRYTILAILSFSMGILVIAMIRNIPSHPLFTMYSSKAGSDSPSRSIITLPATFEVEMEITAYCKEKCCCGRFTDSITASGKPAVGLICAADPKYPFGTKMTVGGVVYTVEDRGSAITGNKLDLLFSSHQAALEFGRKTLKVKVYR